MSTNNKPGNSQYPRDYYFNPLPSSHVLLDPTHDEETLCSGQVSVVVLPQMNVGQPDCEQLGGVTKTGRPSLPAQKLIELTQQAQRRAKVLTKLLNTALEKKS